jgi:dTDP-glucose pyrophosphorylase
VLCGTAVVFLSEEQLNSALSKAVIMARGLGTRMRRVDPVAVLDNDQASAADSGVKGMIPVGRPFIDFLLGALADAGFADICLVIGPEHDAVRRHTEGLNLQRLRITHVIQREPRGTADAVAAAEAFAGSDDFLVINSDNYYPVTALRAARMLDGPGLIAFSARAIAEGGVPVERVRAFPRVEVDERGLLSRLASASPAGDQYYVSMNCWRFGPAIFEACRSITPSPRGELELPDAVEYSMRRLNQRYRVVRSDQPVLDLSSRSDIARVARQLEGSEIHL